MGRGSRQQLTPILFAGDPHRNFAPILRACRDTPPGVLILLGDCDCPAPLPTIMAPAIAAGWDVRWILGNHDTETETAYDNLAGAAPDGDLGLRVTDIHGLRIAGLPGVFRPRVWDPTAGAPQFRTRMDFLASLRPADLWRGGLPLWHRDTISPRTSTASPPNASTSWSRMRHPRPTNTASR